jgi:hypothetical protein
LEALLTTLPSPSSIATATVGERSDPAEVKAGELRKTNFVGVGGISEIAALADFVGSATLVAVMVTVWSLTMDAGAV